MNKQDLHHIDTEYLDNCRRCGGKIELIREGTFWNPVSDITECDCIIIEHENSMVLMGQALSFGNNKILKEKQNQKKGE